MRCQTCDRPLLAPKTKRGAWRVSQALAVFTGIFCLGLIVETAANFDLIGFLAVMAGYAIGTGIMVLWWQVAAKDY